ncbi:ABC-2 transporter permease [Sphaerochaeta globosa]|jgi:hypothetical protein|uniref:Transporter protein n=1 Tax=Sphaerochaeta globosa (strain ATCC BAA-1886 / DSM 22777 / Buddy) TaxID=158189 RepID=F0RYY9_SPHGB|nr:ABC-2 transporter permease [Sphaerochaeta globosa]ADY13196.1 transporter protein [Sphaerochaeta globosa str. Buddy]
MNALLLKDLFLMRKRSGIMLLAIAIFAFLAGVQGGLVNTIMATMMPLMLSFTTLAYDQSDGWEAFAAALPFSRKHIIQSKYFLALLLIGLSIVVIFAIGMIARALPMHELIGSAITQFTFGAFFVAINYPLILKFGFEKSRLYYILVMVVLMSFGAALSPLQGNNSIPSLAFVLPSIAVVCLIISYTLSVSIMKNKEFSGS